MESHGVRPRAGGPIWRRPRQVAALLVLLVGGLASLATSQAAPGIRAKLATDTLQFDAGHLIEVRRLTVRLDPKGLPANAQVFIEIQKAVVAVKALLKVSITDPDGITDVWGTEAQTAERTLVGVVDVCQPCPASPSTATWTITFERLGNPPVGAFQFTWSADADATYQSGDAQFTVPPGASIEAEITR